MSSLTLIIFPPLVNADDIHITATVPGPIPTSPAIITSPADQTTFDSPEITVKGTCPPEGAYITLLRNSVSAGVAPCTAGNFELTISLVVGANELQALVYNVTDNPGPGSSIVTVYYSPPQPIIPVDQPAALPLPIFELPANPLTPLPASDTFSLEYIYKYQVRNVGQPWHWDILAHGGETPYRLSVDWGDGTQSTFGPTSDHTIPLTHTYEKAGVYTPIIRGVDQTGARATLQLLAIVNPNATEETNTIKPPQDTDSAIPSFVILGAPLGAVLIAALIHTFVIQGKLPNPLRLFKK